MSHQQGKSALPVIACNLDDDLVAMLRLHASNPIVLPYGEDRPVWDVPQEAELLFTFFKGWGSAPAQRPAGWPGRLKWVQVAATGIDSFPPWFFEAPLVTTGRGISADAIAEYVIAAIFAHEKHMFDDLLVHAASSWKRRVLGQVSGKKLGLLGFGAIGSRTAAKAQALGMEVSTVRRSPASGEDGIRQFTSLNDMITEIDHLVLAVPLTPDTRRILDRNVLTRARPGLHIINVCRGDVIDNEALLEALERGQVAAATLDVTTPEPLPDGHPFYSHKSIRLTPHISWTSEDSHERIAAKLHANLDRFLSGQSLADIVDRIKGY